MPSNSAPAPLRAGTRSSGTGPRGHVRSSPGLLPFPVRLLARVPDARVTTSPRAPAETRAPPAPSMDGLTRIPPGQAAFLRLHPAVAVSCRTVTTSRRRLGRDGQPSGARSEDARTLADRRSGREDPCRMDRRGDRRALGEAELVLIVKSCGGRGRRRRARAKLPRNHSLSRRTVDGRILLSGGRGPMFRRRNSVVLREMAPF